MVVLQQKAKVLSCADPGCQPEMCEGRAAVWMVLQAAQATAWVDSRSRSLRSSIRGLQEKEHLSGPGEIPRALKHVARSAPLPEGPTTIGLLYKRVT